MEYNEFLQTKRHTSINYGIDYDFMPDKMFDFQKYVTDHAIKKGREIRGLSDPSESPIGTVRRDFAGEQKMKELEKKGIAVRNIMHASGNEEEVREEIKLLFPEITK